MAQAEVQADKVAARTGAPGEAAAALAPAALPPLSVWRSALGVLVVPMLVLAVFDALASAVLVGPGRGLALLVYVLPLFLAIGAALAAGWAASRWLRAAALRQGLPAWSAGAGGTALAAALPVVALGCGLVFALVYVAATRFENHLLAALLCALVALAAVVPLYLLWLMLFVGLGALQRRLAARPPLALAVVWCAGALPLLALFAALIRRNADGFATLGAGLWLGPVLASASLVVWLGLWLRWRLRLARPMWLFLRLLLPLSVLGAWLVGSLAREVPQLAVRGGLWSAKLVMLARLLTDVDRDGASSLFGDEDCAPFNSAIHPLAHDAPGDGVDSNCFGGDAVVQSAGRPPVWFADAPGKAAGLNFVLLTIDAVRADHMSFHGYPRETMPNISAFARKSLVFEHAYAGSNATVMSMLSLWGARSPMQVKNGRAEGSPIWIPELLQREGYRTSAALVAWKRFDTLNRGFDRFDMATPLKIDVGFRGFPDVKLIDDTIAFIDQHKAQPFMAWAHLVGPHHVYERAPGAPNFGDTTRDLYDSELWAADREAGRLLDYLRKQRLLERTVVIVCGDHGEALGDHGVETHRETLYDAEVHTMALMYLPGVEPRVVEQPVLHRDLLTTLMNVLGVERGFSELRGRNLVPMLRGERMADDALFLEMVTYAGKPQKVAVLRWPLKLHYDVKSRRRELYDLSVDPNEQREIGKARPAERDELSQLIARHLEARP
jgi:arylsulfatase A-like enzyme